MKRIGLTQRVAHIESYGERRDCLDQKWAELFLHLGFAPVPLCNLTSGLDTYLESLDLSGVVLTGGNDLSSLPNPSNAAPERDTFEENLLNYCVDQKIPVLGVCRGLQMLNHYYGGTLTSIEGHVAQNHLIQSTDKSSRLGFETQEVNSFHNYAIQQENLGQNLQPLAISHDGTVEAFEHQNDDCLGIMWHPERETPFQESDLNLIKTFFTKTSP